MPSKSAFEFFKSNNIAVDQNYFDTFDSLESSEDFENLFDVLDGFRDKNGNPALITAFSVIANPAFEKIEADKRQQYHYELITETYKRNRHTEKSFNMFLEGIESRLIYPQFHGREHINVKRWCEAINSSSKKEDLVFKQRAVIASKMKDDVFHYPLNYHAAYNYSDQQEQLAHQQTITEGLLHFEATFGFKSLSFVAPCGIWGDEINKTLSDGGVKLQSGQQNQPLANDELNLKNIIWGQKNHLGQVHWRRNCTFEPSRNQDYDWVNRCMKEIEIAFRWGKPAVINSHRVNFIGSIFPENREKTLEKLKSLITAVQRKWPDVEFVNTERLGRIMIDDLLQN